MDNFEFFKDLYFREIERKTDVQNALSIPITLITLLSSALLFFLTSYDYSHENIWECIFILFCCLLIILILFSLFFLIKAFSNFNKGYSYSWLPYPQELYEWHKSLKKYYLDYSKLLDESAKYKNVEDHFQDYLIGNLVKLTDHNILLNNERFSYIYKSKKFLILGFIIMLIIMPIFGSNYFNKQEKIQKIEIVDHTEYLTEPK